VQNVSTAFPVLFILRLSASRLATGGQFSDNQDKIARFSVLSNICRKMRNGPGFDQGGLASPSGTLRRADKAMLAPSLSAWRKASVEDSPNDGPGGCASVCGDQAVD
jgi:hypothetical protein